MTFCSMPINGQLADLRIGISKKAGRELCEFVTEPHKCVDTTTLSTK